MKSVELKKVKFFYSNELNQVKFDAIYEKAVLIRDFKNLVSSKIHSNILFYQNYTKFDMIKEFNTTIEGLKGQDIQNAITDVWTMYSNNLKKAQSNMTFKRKNVSSSKLQMILSFLMKYGSSDLSNFIKTPQKDKNKAIFYKEIQNYCEKYTEKRLLNLALSRRNRFLKNLKLIQFNELSFRTITRINSNIMDFNKNFLSKFNGFINLGGYDDYKKLSIPTKFNKSYHGEKSNYHRDLSKNYNSQSYQIKIINKNKKLIRFAYLIDDLEHIPTENIDFIGVDVNIKNNLFATEFGEIDVDRNLIQKYVKFLQKIDNKKSQIQSKRRQKDRDRWRLIIKNHIKEKMVELIKFAQKNNRNHLILEDLQLLGKSRFTSEFGVNYGRLFRLFGLSSIKNEIVQIAHRHKMSISFVQPEFSSQTCNICGNISPKNRENQEDFLCIECNHQDNADTNASKNLQYRVSSDVLRKSLLIKNEFNEYTPKDHINIGFLKECISNSYQLH